MIIGVPKEIKNNEFRVAITAAGVHEFRTHGHTVLVERGAGLGSGITDEEYAIAGAEIVTEADDVWARADMVMKVKEPIAAEYHRFRKGLILFTYLHLAAEPELTRELINSGVTAIAYETVQEGRTLPLLAPMSEVAGRLSVQVGATSLMAWPAARASSSAASWASARPRLLSSAPASQAPTPQPWPWALARTSPSWTSTSTACANSTRSTRAG